MTDGVSNAMLARFLDEQGTSISAPSTEQAMSLSELARQQMKLEDELEELKTIAADKTAQLQVIKTKKIPELLHAAGVLELALADGSKVKTKKAYSAAIAPENEERAFEWLEKNGHGSILKCEVRVEFKKGGKDNAVKLSEALKSKGFKSAVTNGVHATTLKAFVKSTIESEIARQEEAAAGGNVDLVPELPRELFGVGIFTYAEIIRPKKKG